MITLLTLLATGCGKTEAVSDLDSKSAKVEQKSLDENTLEAVSISM